MSEDVDFYARLPVFDRFENVADPARYRPLPDDWWVGLTDIVGSTQALAKGRYKAVNTAGAAIISALKNALTGREFPFVFGGDGASFAVPACDEVATRAAMEATAAWARDDLGLSMRAALMPVEDVRAGGVDVRVARFAPSPNVAYAMFAGGGLAWAERALKSGRYAVAPAGPGTRPDLTGLSCRWDDIPASRGVMLSLIVAPLAQDDARYRRLLEELLAELSDSPEVVRPVPDGAPGVGWPPPGLDLEARASRRPGESLLVRRLRVAAETLLAYFVMRSGKRVGDFDPAVYRRDVVANSDFRKHDDNLRMTLDCTPALADRVERRLAAAKRDGVARYGLHRQDAAIMTCIVPSIAEHGHVHFIDGASGGYALAARGIK
jgi:hypothetical protein